MLTVNADKTTRARVGSVLAKYSPTSNTAAGSDAEAAAANGDAAGGDEANAVMNDVNGSDSDSILDSDADEEE